MNRSRTGDGGHEGGRFDGDRYEERADYRDFDAQQAYEDPDYAEPSYLAPRGRRGRAPEPEYAEGYEQYADYEGYDNGYENEYEDGFAEYPAEGEPVDDDYDESYDDSYRDPDAEPVRAVTLLFDMVVATLRWANRVDVPTEEEVLAGLAATGDEAPWEGRLQET